MGEIIYNDRLGQPARKKIGFSLLESVEGQAQANWLVKGIAECETHIMLFGDPESGKTLVLFDLLHCIATGKPWRGRRVKQGPVFYLCGEGTRGLWRRQRAWRLHNKVPDDVVIPFYTSDRAAALIDEGDAEGAMDEIKDGCEEHGIELPEAIGIDTLARNMGPGNENSSEDMGKFVANIDDYLIKGLQSTVITSHHSGKADKSGGRGSSAFLGAVDVSYKVSKDGEVKPAEITVECTKSKDFERPGKLLMDLKVVNLGYQDEDGDEVTGATVHHDPTKTPAAKKRPEVNGKYQTAFFEVLVNFYEQKRKNLDYGGHYNQLPNIPCREVKEEAKNRLAPFGHGPGSAKWDNTRKQLNQAYNTLVKNGIVKTRMNGEDIYPAYKEV